MDRINNSYGLGMVIRFIVFVTMIYLYMFLLRKEYFRLIKNTKREPLGFFDFNAKEMSEEKKEYIKACKRDNILRKDCIISAVFLLLFATFSIWLLS